MKKIQRKRFWKAGVLTFATMMLLSACSNSGSGSSSRQASGDTAASGKQESGAPVSGGTITVAFDREPDTLDVHKSTGASVVDEIAQFMGGSLVYMDPVSHEVKPYLAESYKISEDGKTWTFTIRSGITFQDGTPFTAGAYKATLDRILDPKTDAKSTIALIDAIKEVKAPNDQTLVLELKEPFAPLMLNLTVNGWLQPLSLQAIEKGGADYGRNPVGLGPWKFESWQPGESITFTRNDQFKWPEDFYTNKGAVHPDKLVAKFIKNRQTMMAALDSGSIDVATLVPAKDAKKYKDNEKFEVLEQMKTGMGMYLNMNQKTEILQDLQVRQALNMAINKEAIIQSALQGEGVPAYGPLPPTIMGYDKEVESYGYKYNVEEAKKLLDAAGYVPNASGVREKDGKAMQFTLLSVESKSKESQLVQAMLGELGIQVKINTMEPGAMMEAELKGEFDLAVGGYSYFDPDILYLFFHSNQIGGFNYASIKDDTFDQLVVKGRNTIDPEERKKIYAEAQKRMVEQAYIVPIYVDKQFTVVNKRVKGVGYNIDRLQLNDSWVSQ
ncbi:MULTISPECIES: ABC transporter substrate-binding protein [Brevibacillus]|uniref:ABC transporter substrate-binding protein n=1 Tax=Brevibacillus TaxID=55080 RepID=UPI0026205394|nr:ABC transporter substrate-binding protein [Brevibacillus nitrificans]MED1793712.1 ABC transporter substrate-binding protein [Brevibacillus nitrificans]